MSSRDNPWMDAFALPINDCDHPQDRQTVIEFYTDDRSFMGKRIQIIQCLRCRTIKSGDAPWPDLKT